MVWNYPGWCGKTQSFSGRFWRFLRKAPIGNRGKGLDENSLINKNAIEQLIPIFFVRIVLGLPISLDHTS